MSDHPFGRASRAARNDRSQTRVKRDSEQRVRKRTTADRSAVLTIKVDQLRLDYADWKKGFNQRKYSLLQRAYSIACRFERDEGAYEEFKKRDFWNKSRQRPKRKNIDKWVLYYVMNATTKQVRDRAGKYAKVLASFHAQHVPKNAVAQRLAKTGGIERELKKLKKSALNTVAAKTEDLELHSDEKERAKLFPVLKVSMDLAMMDKIVRGKRVKITALIKSEGAAKEAKAITVKVMN